MGIFTTGRHAKTNPINRIAALIGSLALTATALVAIDAPAQAVTQTYSYTGGPQIYVVPDAVTSLTVSMNGAQGGTPTGGGTGGKGATVTATIAVNPGEVLMIMVGGNGTNAGGWNGGGRGAGYGGGATDIRRQGGAFNTSSSCAYSLSCNINDRIIVAGGGGGGGWAQGATATANGGDAGQSGSAGAASNFNVGDATAGGGATPSAGGAAGSGTFTSSGQGASAGSLGSGAQSAWVASATGGGGGGGYYGGGSGGVSQDPSTPQADGAGGGGGGSSWAGGTGVTAATFTSGSTTGNGSVTIDPPSAIPAAAFGFSGTEQFYTVPANTSEIYVRMYGAGAGTNGDIVYGRIPVTSGQVLQINIGGVGYGDTTFIPGKTNGQGGWNGGGTGYYGVGWGGGQGGGGASDIRVCANASSTNLCGLADRIVVAGGAGGGSYGAWGLGGGYGGYGVNGDGGNGAGGDFGLGGSLTAGGGVNGTGIATAGALGVGGTAGQPFYGAGGGGGGLYGGGGGNGSGGGGGSSCASITGPCNATTNILGTANAQIGHSRSSGGSLGDGMAVITAMPVATTGAISNVTSTTASVAGTINAKFLASTPKLFIGTNQTTIDSCSSVSAPCTASSTVLRTASLATTLAGTATQSVSGAITGLSANTTYYYRVCAQSVAGYSCGATSNFTTQLSITNSALANGTVGQAYTDTLAASGGSGSYSSWALVNSTTLPAGLTLNTQTGAITGTPTAVTSGNVDVQVTDSLSATVTKTLAITIAAAPPVQSQGGSSGSMPSTPIAGSVFPRTTSTTGGNTVTITGSNLAGSTVTVGGTTVQLLTNTSGSLSFIVPSGLSGSVSVTITNTRGTLNLVNALIVSAEVTTQGGGTTEPPATSGTMVFDNFAPGSATLTAKHLAKLKSTARTSAGFKTMVCIGFTMGPTVLKADKVLSMNRANNVCAALHKLVPGLAIVKSTGVTETGVGGSVRRVEVTFKN